MNATTSITALATTTDSVAITSPWSSHDERVQMRAEGGPDVVLNFNRTEDMNQLSGRQDVDLTAICEVSDGLTAARDDHSLDCVLEELPKALDVKQTPASVDRKAHSYDPDAA